jgi:hypothetical protein
MPATAETPTFLGQEIPMVKCGINKLYLLTILLFLGPYVWILERVITTSEPTTIGTILAPTLLFILPIYAALFQVKTLKIEGGLMTVFYPFRLWTKSFDLRELEKWKYRKTTKTLRFEIYWKSRYVTIKFKDKSWLTILFSLGLTNFDELLDYLNERHKELRTFSRELSFKDTWIKTNASQQ